MSDSVLQLLPGQTPPLAVITPTDQRGVLYIITALCLATSIVSLLIRGYVRVEFSQSYGKDDISIGAAFILLIIQSCLIFVAARKGVGEALSDIPSHDLLSLQKTYYAANLLYIATLWATKISTLFLILRLAVQRIHTRTTSVVLAVTGILGLVSFLLAALDCNLNAPWIFIGVQCSAEGAHWRAIATFDIITELLPFATLCFIINSVQIPAKKKLAIVAGFAFRLLLLLPLAFRLHYVLASLHSQDITLRQDRIVINTQVELVTAMVAATVPCLRPFMAATYTTWGGRVDTVSGSEYKSGSNSGKKHITTGSKSVLSSLRMGRSKKGVDELTSRDDISLEPMSQSWSAKGMDGHNTERHPSTIRKQSGDDSGAMNQADDQQSLGSHDSQRMIIRRDVEWNVRFENRPEANGTGIAR
ncbi:hypothetical protein LTR10_019705 [Elasticomyces elasticus]|uniref:Rhodopsin domain-containing protein n=1 Tax=Exophiala sideris TaxID=1016849 RepID=A0ABR0IXD6_9EURO|nr:hypothetical protein LTR10_019705 [Elasticomyces elasticus]KAK5022115.1 hypothetical protein LTS07_010365 [Exophiala sideris]KAK5025080.1 hypothetical protein LTR13_010640 [Exophiala sideris]KAK5051174.1 hypothetical protein LTR69_010386 [Exophiala sideris]KAK5176839.1 hypothetical protein LTR44_010660 [Eurotiomycetes sp. CCFEE 6388]